MTCEFTVTFRGELPDRVKVGDKLAVSGVATVRSIQADLINITAYGSDPEYTLGEATIDLYSNRFEVGAA